MRPSFRGLLPLLLASLAPACSADEEPAERQTMTFLAEGITPEEMTTRLEQFVPAPIDFADSALTADQREMIALLVEASDVIDSIFLRQVSPRNPEWRARVERATGPGSAEARAYFDLMYGPWDRLEENEPFLDVGPKPPGAGYYPEDLEAPELQGWMDEHPDQSEAFQSYHTIVRRGSEGLEAVPYAEAYREDLERAADLLRRAAERAENASLARYLRTRADAFLSNDYFESDMAWMDIRDSAIEPTIGPYEVYEDELMGYKAAFESFVTVNDPEASARLDSLEGFLPELEAALPVDERFRNPNRGFESPIRVVDVVYTAGDTRAGVQTIAFNLPNDERVREAKGSKKVMLRNVARAKFENVLRPIAERTMSADVAGRLAFEPWFTYVLMHELAHGLGPGRITLPSGERTTVNQALRERYATLEEAKADVVGMHALAVLQEKGVYDEDFVRRAFASYVADLFRSVRFGADDAHGQGSLIQLNHLRERNAIPYDPEAGRFRPDLDRVREAVRELAREILTIQAEGSYESAGSLIGRLGESMDPQMQTAVAALTEVPVDIRPEYTVREKMERWSVSPDTAGAGGP